MRCYTPHKKAYRSRRAAKRAMQQLYRNRVGGAGRLHVYRCKAGHWHVGHVR